MKKIAFAFLLALVFALGACTDDGGAPLDESAWTAVTDLAQIDFDFLGTDVENLTMADIMGNFDTDHADGSLEDQLAPPPPGEPFAIIHTCHGDIFVRLFWDVAPLAVENFVTLALDGEFTQVLWHRVVEDFMIQGGGHGSSIWGTNFGDELTPRRQHIRGALAMANAGPFTNSRQFFIVQNSGLLPVVADQMQWRIDNQDHPVTDGAGNFVAYVRDVWPAEFMQHYLNYGGAPHLDFEHTVFGQVFYGMDVVDSIAAVEVVDTINHRPVEDVFIYGITIAISN